MTAFTFPKAKQGKMFRLEVGNVSPPRVTLAPPEPGANPPEGPLLVGEPLQIEADVLGFAAGESVEFRIFEPYRLHEEPVDTLTAQTSDEERGVSVSWTYDHAAHKDSIHSTRFVCVVQVGRMVNISEPFWILAPFTKTLQDPSGEPLAGVPVRLRAPGREDVLAETDDEGKLELFVPPGDYVLDIVADDDDGPLPQPFEGA